MSVLDIDEGRRPPAEAARRGTLRNGLVVLLSVGTDGGVPIEIADTDISALVGVAGRRRRPARGRLAAAAPNGAIVEPTIRLGQMNFRSSAVVHIPASAPRGFVTRAAKPKGSSRGIVPGADSVLPSA